MNHRQELEKVRDIADRAMQHECPNGCHDDYGIIRAVAEQALEDRTDGEALLDEVEVFLIMLIREGVLPVREHKAARHLVGRMFDVAHPDDGLGGA